MVNTLVGGEQLFRLMWLRTLDIALWSQRRKVNNISGHNLKSIGGQAICDLAKEKKNSQSKIWMALIKYIRCWDYHMILPNLNGPNKNILLLSSKPKPFLFSQNLSKFLVSCMLGFLIEINKMVLLNITM